MIDDSLTALLYMAACLAAFFAGMAAYDYFRGR
jgi:hypothetical protein